MASEGARRSEPHVFVDRREAGRQLAERLSAELSSAVVVGLARGGVEVAAEVSRRLRAPLEALAVRKVRHPHQPEYAIGAVTPDGGVYLRPDSEVSPEVTERLPTRSSRPWRSTAGFTRAGPQQRWKDGRASWWTTALPPDRR
jgi:Phosphoribosyl transferase domain